MVEYKTYQPDFIRKQVDLIWRVTDSWKYEYQTSYETVEKAYARDGFDPNSRVYAFEEDKLIGFVGADITTDKEGNKISTMRLPLADIGRDFVIEELMGRIEGYLKGKGVSVIKSPAGVGLGDTIEIAEKLGYERLNELFRRTYCAVDDLNISGNTDGVYAYDDDKDQETVKELFMKKMGMPEKQGEGFFNWARSNSLRKWKNDPLNASWQLLNDDQGLNGFSYLMRSDHNPRNANSMPFWFERDPDTVIGRLLSAHVAYMKGIDKIGNYLIPNIYHLEEVYGKFGFKYDPSYVYQKEI